MEGLVTGRDSIIRGAKLIVITNWNPVHISRPVHKLYPLEVRSVGEGLRTTGVCNRGMGKPTRNFPRRNAVLDARWKSQLMLDS